MSKEKAIRNWHRVDYTDLATAPDDTSKALPFPGEYSPLTGNTKSVILVSEIEIDQTDQQETRKC